MAASVISLAQAAARRGAAGLPLPTVYQSFKAKDVVFCRSQLILIVGEAGSGKSLLTANLLIKMGVPSLALLLDQDQASAVARMAAVTTGEPFLGIRDRIDDYQETLLGPAGHVMAAFSANEFDDIKLQLDAYEERFGEPPAVLLLDNAGNLTSGLDNEWAALKALTLELDEIAREEQICVIACAHTTDLASCEPAARDKILGRVSQYPRMILSVNFNPVTGEYKVAYVKNSSGVSDKQAQFPITLWADPARMAVTETPPHPQVAAAARELTREAFRNPPNQPIYDTDKMIRSFGGLRG